AGVFTVTTGVGQLVVNATTGAYTYTANNNTSQLPADNFFFFDTDGDRRTLPSFPTRRSSDLNTPTGGTTSATVDDDGLAGNNPRWEEHTIKLHTRREGAYTREPDNSGTLNFSFGADTPGTVNFASMGGTSGSVGTETVNYTWS